MKRILAALSVALIAGAMASPAFAQTSPVDDVGGVVVEQPIPGVDVPDEAVAPGVVERPAPGVAAGAEPRREATGVARGAPRVAAGGQLATTGLEVTTGAALAAGLLLLGGASVFMARRKAAPQV